MLTEIKVDGEMVVKFSYKGVGKLRDDITDDNSIGVQIKEGVCDYLDACEFEDVDVHFTDLRVERRGI